MLTRLVRPRTDRMIGGVCGGLGIYFGLDPVIVRLVFVVLTFTAGFPIVLYPILWLVMPDDIAGITLPPDARFDPQTGQPLPPRTAADTVRLEPAPPSQRNRNLALVLVGIGALILVQSLGEMFHFDLGDIGLPLLLIGFGVYLLRGQRVH